jgi:type II secretory pathway pseudopilin PulG
MQETLLNIFTHPFVIGLCIGLIIALYVWLRAIGKAREARRATNAQANELRAQIETLKSHLHTQMEITAKGNESLKDELIALQQTNQNLSQTIGALKQKPGRVEIRTLHLYEKAIRLMNARAPGFSSAWESAINEAEAEIKQEESGIIGWIRKPFMFRKTGSTELLGDAEQPS